MVQNVLLCEPNRTDRCAIHVDVGVLGSRPKDPSLPAPCAAQPDAPAQSLRTAGPSFDAVAEEAAAIVAAYPRKFRVRCGDKLGWCRGGHVKDRADYDLLFECECATCTAAGYPWWFGGGAFEKHAGAADAIMGGCPGALTGGRSRR
jgi:hypothetical protein